MVKNQKNCQKAVFDSSKEASWCTERNAKNPSSWQGMVSEKIKNNLEKWSCFDQNGQKWLFLKVFFWFCGQPYFIKSWGFLRCVQCIRTLLLSYQKQLFDIFSDFHPKGGPLWFRTSQKLTTPLKMAESWKQKYFCEQNYKWIKNSDGTACLKGWIKISWK